MLLASVSVHKNPTARMSMKYSCKKETQEERESTLAYNNPWVLNYAHQPNETNKTPQNQPNKTTSQTGWHPLCLWYLVHGWVSL